MNPLGAQKQAKGHGKIMSKEPPSSSQTGSSWQAHVAGKDPCIVQPELRSATANDLPQIAENLRMAISAAVARNFGVLAVDREDDKLVLVSKEPISDKDLEKIRFYCGSMDFRIAGMDEFNQYRIHFDELLKTHFPAKPGRLSGDCCADRDCPETSR